MTRISTVYIISFPFLLPHILRIQRTIQRVKHINLAYSPSASLSNDIHKKSFLDTSGGDHRKAERLERLA